MGAESADLHRDGSSTLSQVCEDVIRWVPDLLPVAPKLQRSSASLQRRSERALLRTTTCEASPALQQFLALYGSGGSGAPQSLLLASCIMLARPSVVVRAVPTHTRPTARPTLPARAPAGSQ